MLIALILSADILSFPLKREVLLNGKIMQSEQTIAYKDRHTPIPRRVSDLLSRMTLEEKIGQMNQVVNKRQISYDILYQKSGSAFHVIGSSAADLIQTNKKNRLQIPLLLGIDAIHGHSFFQHATIFPTQLGFSSSWDTDLIERIGSITAYEMRYTGPSWTFSPVVCIARDLRWGRVGETFGEDPYLIGLFASSLIKGLQGDKLSNDPDKVMATAKHFAGYSNTVGGLDASETELSKRTLESFFLPQFQKCVEAGVGSFMSAYQSIDGIPAVANKWLLNDTLRTKWGFDGFVVSDFNSVGNMVTMQKFVDSYEEAATKQTIAGNDMVMQTSMFFEAAIHAVKNNQLPIKYVDRAVSRILEAKFKLGLFEDERVPDIEKAMQRNCKPEFRDTALEAALKSLVLLKNDGILPLNGKEKITLLGPNAYIPHRQLGDWSIGPMHSNYKPYPRNLSVTIRDALSQRLGKDLVFKIGCTIEKDDKGDSIESAIQSTENADVVIIVVGDSESYIGEFKSTATLELMGSQIELINQIAKTKKRFIIDIVSSKPLILPPSAKKASAIIQQISPGMLGGKAFEKIIYGEAEPRGRLTISIPYHSGQNPIYYQKLRGVHNDHYADLGPNIPKYPFGFGLTYTTFSYINAELDKSEYFPNEEIRVKVTINNTGNRNGTEVVQCYISIDSTSVVWVDKELKGYELVSLQPGESKTINIKIPVKECSIVNQLHSRVVMQGGYKVLVGKSSMDIQKELSFSVTTSK